MITLSSGQRTLGIHVPFTTKASVIAAGVGVILLGIFSKFLGQRRRNRKGNETVKSNPLRKTQLGIRGSVTDVRTPYRYSSLHSDKSYALTPKLVPNGDVASIPLTPQQYGVMGMEALDTAVAYWEDALAAYTPVGLNQFALTNVEENNFTHDVEAILEQAYQLQRICSHLFLFENSVLFQSISERSTLQDRYSESDRRTVTSFGSADSFVSALGDFADLKDFEDTIDINSYELYQSSLELALTGQIPYRHMRMELVCCQSEAEYLAKVHSIRLAFQLLFEKPDALAWFVNVGGQLLTDLLIYAEKDPKVCQTAYDDMIDFVQGRQNWPVMEEELEARGVPCLSFYDVVLDYMLMDAFEDLEDPPTSVKAVVQNRWLSNGFKESALSTAVWSVLQAKRRRLKHSNGFSSHFYAISEHITPVLAWGFLGPNEDLKETCLHFKNEVEGFIRDIFSFHKARYTTAEILSEDVFNLAQERFEVLSQKLSL